MTDEQAPRAQLCRERLLGRVALVTGAGSGIGRSIALRLASEGCAVGVMDQNGAAAEQVCQEVLASDGVAVALQADITRRRDIRAAVRRLTQDIGPIDILVNNAGIGTVKPFLTTGDRQWRRTVSVNLYGTFVVSQEVARLMVKRGVGRIVNIASLSAHIANGHQSAYSASKAGIISLTRSIAFELGPHGVTANAVSPGPVHTRMTDAMVSPDERAAKETRSPLRRLGLPEEIAAVVAFLASDDASYLNGAVISADGGLRIAGVSAVPSRT